MFDIQERTISMEEMVSAIKKNIGTIIVVGLLFSLMSFILLIVTEKKIKATTDLLIIQDQIGSQDFYSLSKSAEYLGGVLSETMHSSLFINEVKNTGKIRKDFFPVSEKKSLKKWDKTLVVKKNLQLGIINVEIFDDNYKNTVSLSKAVIDVLTTRNYLFKGESALDIKVLSGPIIERNPGGEKVAIAVIGGFLSGVIFKIVYLYSLLLKKNNFSKKKEEYFEGLLHQ